MFVYAKERFVKAHPVTGSMVVFHYGQRVDADDPIVKASPRDFCTADELGVVETATANPGEKRQMIRR